MATYDHVGAMIYLHSEFTNASYWGFFYLKDGDLVNFGGIHSWEEDASGAKYCATCGVQTGELEGEQKVLQGKWSSDKVSINGSDASYYVPNSAVVGCTDLTLNISVNGVTGNPFGTYMLYGKDLSGAWRIIGGFDLTEEAKSKKMVFNFKPDTPVSFTALAIALKDPNVGKYNLDYTIDYTGVIIQQ